MLATVSPFSSVEFGCVASVQYPASPAYSQDAESYAAARAAHEAECTAITAAAHAAIVGRKLNLWTSEGGYDGEYWTTYFVVAFVPTPTGHRFVKVRVGHRDSRDYNGTPFDRNAVVFDATPEVRDAAEAYNSLVDARDERKERLRVGAANAEREAVAGAGDLVVVARGRKVPIGTVGVVAGVFQNEYGESARVTLVDRDGNTDPRDKSRTWYTSPKNLEVLVQKAECQPDWRRPVLPETVTRSTVGFVAWQWANRDAGPCVDVTDEHGVLWHCRNCELGFPCGVRARRVRSLWAQYADRMVGETSDGLTHTVMALLAADPPKRTETEAHDLASVLDGMESGRWDLESALQEFTAAQVTENANGTIGGIVRAIVERNMGEVWAPAPKVKAQRAPRKPSAKKAKGMVAESAPVT